MNKNTSQKLQICRAISIVAVVCIHTCNNGYIRLAVRPVLNFCVAAFLFISGFLVNYESDNLLQFYRKRLLRVLVPYSIWSLIYTACYRNYESFLYFFLTGQCCSIYYYILVYMQLTLLTPVLKKLMLSRNWKLGFVITPVAIAFQYMLTILGKPLQFPWNANLCFVWIIFFYFGMCIRSGKITISSIMPYTMVIAVLLQYIEAVFWLKLMNNYDMAITQIKISSMITSLAVICVGYNWITKEQAMQKNIVTKALLRIGDVSFGIYLTHMLVIHYTDSILSRLIFPLNTIVVLTLNIVCIFCVRYLSGNRCSKWLGMH